MKFLFLLLFVFLSTGCASTTDFNPQSLGISTKQWDQYSQEQRQAILESSRMVRSPEDLSDNTPLSILSVRIAGGKALMPPYEKHYSYQPVRTTIKSDSCKEVLLKHSLKRAVYLKLCYVKNALYVDPSPYKVDFQYGLRLAASPVWDRGFSYMSINSEGYAQLRHATITVKRRLMTSYDTVISN